MRNRPLNYTLRLGVVGALILIGFLGGAQRIASASFVNDLLRSAIPLGLPADLWDYYIPRDNVLSAPRVELGRQLFFDKRLSSDGTVSCATCHDPQQGFADGRTVAEGVGQKRGTRNSPTLLNVLFNPGQFWDGRADTLEEQAVLPLTNPLEMGNESLEAVIARVSALPEYRVGFVRVFGGGVTSIRMAQAISNYERTLIAGDSPFDRFVAGETSAISDEVKRGFALFRGKGRCSRCHTFSEQMPFFTDFAYHNTGVAARHPNFERLSRVAYDLADKPGTARMIEELGRHEGGDELGRMLFSHLVFDLGSFRTPSLRNVALTAPYFHNGSAKTLEDVVRFYNEGGKANLNREWDLNALALSDGEQRDLVAFLQSLTGRIDRY
ncbi:MAG: cytochrome c peroxidase [Acidobacteriota bacterium]